MWGNILSIGSRIIISLVFVVNALVLVILQNLDSILFGATIGVLVWSVIDFIRKEGFKSRRIQGFNSILSGGVSGSAIFGFIPVFPLTFVPMFFVVGIIAGLLIAIVADFFD